MRKSAFTLCVFLICACAAAAQTLPLYQLPQSLPPRGERVLLQNMLVGTETGLYRINNVQNAIPLWTGGRVNHIERVLTDKGEEWFFLTSQGLLHSFDLEHFESYGTGLPVLTVKKYENGQTSLQNQPRGLKDFAVNPSNPAIMATLTRDEVFLSRDYGKTWKSLGFSARTAGVKAIAVADMPVVGKNGETELVVFMSHALYGLGYIKPDAARPVWQDLTAGFETLPNSGMIDEIADILPVVQTDEDGNQRVEIYLSQTFLPALYRLNWQARRAEQIYRTTEPAGTFDGLFWTGNNVLFTKPGNISLFNPDSKAEVGPPSELYTWMRSLNAVTDPVYSVYVPRNLSGFSSPLVLSELWMLSPDKVIAPYTDRAMNKRSLYVPAGQIIDEAGINRFLKIMEDNELNSLVVDMKDDNGLLRYNTRDPLVKEKGYVSRYAVNLDTMMPKFKEKGMYLIARIVVFKDKNLAGYSGGKYAVWDRTTNRPWSGIKGYEETEAGEGQPVKKTPLYYDESWVDPYSEEVWQYNIAIAQELIARGFDEIQFDYIRFPTDGLNLKNASYRWKSEGMDMESALISFLSYARQNIKAPIGIDIYGANGWYRSGARTGQDLEQLADYVDVICPMFYPSHFEQPFLAYAPAEERPYRILFYGTYRSSVIGRNRVVIRPWLQAFYLNVSYDRTYYNADYVKRQVYGVRNSVDHGYMFWNNSGRYDDISPPPGTGDRYPWKSKEVEAQVRVPSLGGVWAASKDLPSLIDSSVPPQSLAESKTGE